MKKLLVLSAGLLAGLGAFAQTTAQDWNKPDCAGKNHHLFAELDSGNVVVLEYVMMSCGSCVTAGNGLKTIAAPYKTSHPGRVRLYSIGYTNSYTCAQMQSWQTTNNFTHPVFTGGAADVAYYGGMGMPTIVVVGGNTRKVYYKKLGYTSSDNAAITSAINLALSQSSPMGIKNDEAAGAIKIYPNPAGRVLHFSVKELTADQVFITDLTGKVLLAEKLSGAAENQLKIQSLPTGVYLVNLRKAGHLVSVNRFIKE